MLGLAELFDRGGPVLYILFIVTLFIWFIIFSKYLSTSYNNKNWIKSNFDTFSNGVNINRSNIHLFEESFLIHIKRVSTQKLKMLDGLIITGGDFDINPKLYNQPKNGAKNLKSKRTNFSITFRRCFN